MRFLKYGTTRQVWVNIKKYSIKWSEPSASNLQTLVKIFLFPFWKNYIVLEEFVIPGSRLRCDFINLNKSIAIEVQGSQHFEFNKFFHNNSRSKYLGMIKRDINKYHWLEANGFTIIELDEKDIKQLSIEYIKEKFGVYIM